MQLADHPLSSSVVTDDVYGCSPLARPMTYQLIMLGSDGIVFASDRREVVTNEFGMGSPTNSITKIGIDPSGVFAWGFSGSEVGPVATGLLEDIVKTGALNESNAIETLRICGEKALTARDSNAKSEVHLIHGPSRRIFRAKMFPSTRIDELQQSVTISGHVSNLASFIPDRFASNQLTCEQLAHIGAYTIRMAGESNNMYIGELCIAIYRDSTGRFAFVDHVPYWDEAERLDNDIRALFHGCTKSPAAAQKWGF